jgi:hypothetical protein
VAGPRLLVRMEMMDLVEVGVDVIRINRTKISALCWTRLNLIDKPVVSTWVISLLESGQGSLGYTLPTWRGTNFQRQRSK